MPYRILIIEDNPEEREQLAFLLREAGYLTLGAENSKNALAEAPFFKPDCIISDYIIPGKDGLETAKEIHEIPGMEKIPVILTSGFNREILEMEYPNYDCVEFIPKPLDFETLNEKIKELLE